MPAEAGTCFFAASEPAIASMPIASGKRAKNMQMPSSVFQNGVFAESPPNALPLLFEADDSAYRISLKPWIPGLAMPASPAGASTAIAVPTTTSAHGISTTRLAIFISCASIFLPRYSGVRPTMSPAMNTATTANAMRPYRPEPTPPKITSPSWISHIGTRPPSGVNESCIALTEPFEAAVVALAHRVELTMPKRVSLPSILPPACSADAC